MNWSRWLVGCTCYILVVMSVMGLEAFRPLIKPWPWGWTPSARWQLRYFLRYVPVSDEHWRASWSERETGSQGRRSTSSNTWQEKGHRLGIFLTVISALILVFGLGAESNRIAGLGFMGVLFGYWLARLWYWFRSA